MHILHPYDSVSKEAGSKTGTKQGTSCVVKIAGLIQVVLRERSLFQATASCGCKRWRDGSVSGVNLPRNPFIAPQPESFSCIFDRLEGTLKQTMKKYLLESAS